MINTVNGPIIATSLYSKDKNIDIANLVERLRFGGVKGSLIISTDGSIRLLDEATAWDDLRVPIERTKKIATKEPVDVVYKGGIVSSFQHTADQGITFNAQMSHKWKEGSDIFFHLHYVLPVTVNSGSAQNVKWNFSYSWTNINEPYPEPTIAEEILDVRDGIIDVNKIFSFSALDATDKKISSQLICSLTRDTTVVDNYAGNVYLTEVDFHYQVDGMGSEAEYIKEVITL